MIPNWPLHFLSYIKIFFLDSIDNFYEILTWTIYLNTTQCLWSITWYKYGLTVFKIVSLIQWLTFIHNNYCSGLCLAPFWINSEAFDGIVLNSTTLPVIFVFNTCIIVVRGSVKRFCLFDWYLAPCTNKKVVDLEFPSGSVTVVAKFAAGDHVWVRPGAVGRQGHGRASWWVGPGWWWEGGAATWSWLSSSSSTATSAGQHAGYAHEPASQFVIPIIYVWQEQLALLNFASKRPWKQQLLFTIVLHLEKKIVGSDLKTEYLLWLYYFYPSSLALSHEPVDCSYNSTWCDM